MSTDTAATAAVGHEEWILARRYGRALRLSVSLVKMPAKLVRCIPRASYLGLLDASTRASQTPRISGHFSDQKVVSDVFAVTC